MTMFIQNNATGAGAGAVNAQQGFVDLSAIANFDTGLGLGAGGGNQQQVTYNRTDPGIPPTRLANLINTAFSPDYGLGAGPQAVNIIVIPAGTNFTFNDGTIITAVAGRALPPSNSGLAGAGLNTTNNCLAVYDTTQNNGNGYCVARAGTGGTIDLDFPGSAILYHELSHCFRIVNNTLLALTAGCNPSSPEENAAIVDENDQRTQRANSLGIPIVLRDAGIHCGGGGPCAGGGGGESCCIVATTATGSGLSDEVQSLRSLRDGLLRKTEVGFSFFQTLHRDYYGFSPQVCTLMAKQPELRSLVLEGFVRPLVTILRLVEGYALDRCDAEILGQEFVAAHRDEETAATRLVTLARARQLLAGADVMLTPEELKLAELLAPALVSDHVRWALIEPLEIYEAALVTYLTEPGIYNVGNRVGAQLYENINAWADRMPLDSIWGSLPVSELGNELKALDTILLRTPAVRAGFRHRLKGKFGDVTAIVTFLDAEQGVNT